jgi:hypothetical protein
MIRSGRLLRTSSTMRCRVSSRMANDAGLLGLTRKKALMRGSSSLAISASGYCQTWRPFTISLCLISMVSSE